MKKKHNRWETAAATSASTSTKTTPTAASVAPAPGLTDAIGPCTINIVGLGETRSELPNNITIGRRILLVFAAIMGQKEAARFATKDPAEVFELVSFDWGSTTVTARVKEHLSVMVTTVVASMPIQQSPSLQWLPLP